MFLSRKSCTPLLTITFGIVVCTRSNRHKFDSQAIHACWVQSLGWIGCYCFSWSPWVPEIEDNS